MSSPLAAALGTLSDLARRGEISEQTRAAAKARLLSGGVEERELVMGTLKELRERLGAEEELARSLDGSEDGAERRNNGETLSSMSISTSSLERRVGELEGDLGLGNSLEDSLEGLKLNVSSRKRVSPQQQKQVLSNATGQLGENHRNGGNLNLARSLEYSSDSVKQESRKQNGEVLRSEEKRKMSGQLIEVEGEKEAAEVKKGNGRHYHQCQCECQRSDSNESRKASHSRRNSEMESMKHQNGAQGTGEKMEISQFVSLKEQAGKQMHGKTLIFAAREMAGIAKAAVARAPEGSMVLGSIEWKRFDVEDGWPNLKIANAHDLEFNDVMFLASFHSPDVVFEQLSALYALARYGARTLKIILPFFPTGTMERVDVFGEVATAASLARILSVIPQAARGPTQLVILDIHALAEQFYFSDTVIVHLKSCIRLLHERLRVESVALSKQVSESSHNDTFVIVFPDDGAWKRFHNKFNQFKCVICHKIRIGDERIVQVRDGAEFVNKDARCVIVDDLVKSGGTLLQCATALRQLGCEKVSAYVTHGVFPGQSYKKFLHINPNLKKEHRLEKFWITDSVPTVAAELKSLEAAAEPFEILSIAPLIPFLRPNIWSFDPSRYD